MLCGFGECRHSIVSRVSVGFERVIEEFWLVQHSLRAWGFSFMVLGLVTSFLNRRSPPNPTPSIEGPEPVLERKPLFQTYERKACANLWLVGHNGLAGV